MAGVDVSFFPDGIHAVAAVVVLSYPDMEVLYEATGNRQKAIGNIHNHFHNLNNTNAIIMNDSGSYRLLL